MLLLERCFRVEVPIDVAWAKLERIEDWPSWARHIRRIELQPPGGLTLDSEGEIRLTNGVRSTFRRRRSTRAKAGSGWAPSSG